MLNVSDVIAEATPLITHYEGLRYAPYLCPSGVPTIGYGTTRYPNGRPVTLSDPPITARDAINFFQHDIDRFATQVVRRLSAPTTVRQAAAFLSLAYNIGFAAFGRSTAVRHHDAGAFAEAAAAIELWNKSRGQILLGLRRRRRAERLVYEGTPVPEALAAARTLV